MEQQTQPGRQGQDRRLPDFIIAGAMKCGTTTLREILHLHPGIFIPNHEIHFFDVDSHLQHPHFFFHEDSQWYYPRFEAEAESYLDWYANLFADAREDQLIGEDSATYLASHRVPERIARFMPEVKLIILLRDPASRAYSHYWFLVRAGRAAYSFEDTLQMVPETLIQRSQYKRQIEHYLRYIPAEQIRFVIFEQFVRQMPEELAGILRFIGASTVALDVDSIQTHFNPAKTPRDPNLQLWRNRLLRPQRRIQRDHPFEVPESGGHSNALWVRAVHRAHNVINPQLAERPPQMRPETRRFLNDYFAAENAGLDELIGKDVSAYWYKDKG